MTKLALAISTRRCIGCHTCAMACKMQNNVPMGMSWNTILTEDCEVLDGSLGEFPNLKRVYLPLSCQHCEEAPCLKAGPTGSTYRDDKGRVGIDYEKCIGCRMCMAACPYNVRHFNWTSPVNDPDFDYGDKDVKKRYKGVVEKCTLCRERTDRDELPMCVISCPTHARVFGDLDDPSSEISHLRKQSNVRILLEEMGTHPQVFYLQ